MLRPADDFNAQFLRARATARLSILIRSVNSDQFRDPVVRAVRSRAPDARRGWRRAYLVGWSWAHDLPGPVQKIR